MKLKHRLGGLLRTLSLLFCGLFLLMGLRSCKTADLVQLTTANHHYEIVTIPWSVRLTIAGAWTPPRPIEWHDSDEQVFPPFPPDLYIPVFGQRPIYRTWYFFGIGVKKDHMPVPTSGGGRATVTYTIFTVPFQTLAFAAFLPVAWRILTIRRRRRLREFRVANSQCPSCGYDVRFSPGRCPECGQVIKPAIVPADDSISIRGGNQGA